MWCSLIFHLKRKSSHDNIQIVTVSWVLIRTQYSREYFLYLRCQHFNVMHFFYTSCLPCILKLAKNQLNFFFYYCHSRQVTSHLDIRVSAHPLPVAHPVISRFPEIRGFPAALDSSSLIITLSIETVAMEAGDSELIGILGNYILAADTLMPKYGYCCIARSWL